MKLEEFKRIWWMEYLHRQWGRTIGAVFFLPAAFFWARGYFNKGMKIRAAVFGTLIGCQVKFPIALQIPFHFTSMVLQGLLGWYMVRSGLEAERFQGPESSEPRVSQYRLAAHLSMAFLLYTLFVWNGLDKVMPAQQMPQVANT
jgi:heme a synthase